MVERIEIAEGVAYLVTSPEARASFLGCCGLMVEDRRKLIIDGNMGPVETPPLLERERPDVCVISHFHVDHSRWAHEAALVPGVKVHVPEAERRYLVDVDHFVDRCGVPGELAVSWKEWLTGFAGLKPVPRAVGLAPDDVLDLGHRKVRVVDAAGHSPGHQAYWMAEQRILFCSDIGVDAFGPWYGWEDARIPEYVASVERLVALDATLLVTSHGGIVRDDIEATLRGCVDVMRQRERCIREDLEAGLDLDACARRGHIYGDLTRFRPPLDRMYLLWERNMVAEHARVLEMGGIDAL